MRRVVLPLALLASVALAAGPGFAAQDVTREKPSLKTAGQASVRDADAGADRIGAEAELEMKIIKISGDQAGNKRFPGVAENRKGDRLVIFRGPNNLYWYSFYRKGGTWSTSRAIPDQMLLEDHTCVDVDADSSGRFHCVWEEPDVCVVYASFLDGKWTKPFKLDLPGKHDMGVAIAVRSNDEVIIANADVIRAPVLTKDVFFFFKRPGEDDFRRKNMINDHPSSNQPSICVDLNDHIWLAHKAEPKVGSDELIIRMLHYRADNDTAEAKTVSDIEGWRFWPQAAINTDGMLMVGWAHTQNRRYEWRLYNTETKVWSEVYPAGPGIPVRPWAAFWSRLVAHGENFYWAVMDPERVLRLLKFDMKKKTWDDLGVVSRGGVEYHDMYAGYDTLLIAWNEAGDGTDVFLTTIAITPAGPPPVEISGKVQRESAGIAGVAMTGLPGEPETDDSGNYRAFVETGWTGTVVPTHPEWQFRPESRAYANVTEEQLGQDYAAFPPISSVANLRVENRIERGFFRGYYLNALTWEANPDNAELTLSAQRVYRKGLAEADSAWTRIAEVSGTVLNYEDRNLPKDNDYVYAVTCVDADGNESPVY